MPTAGRFLTELLDEGTPGVARFFLCSWVASSCECSDIFQPTSEIDSQRGISNALTRF
jgi:hypothetical protein